MTSNRPDGPAELAESELARSPAADLYNSAVAAFAVVASAEIGLIDEIEAVGSVDIGRYARSHQLHEQSVAAIADALSCAGIVDVKDGTIWPTPGFGSVSELKSIFLWLLGGCGELLRTSGQVARKINRQPGFIKRDARLIGLATAEVGARFIDPAFDAAFADLDYRCVADLGCGSGDRLIRAVQARPDARGIGIDIAPAAVELARERVANAGLTDRAVIVEADVRELTTRPEFAEVDFVCSFLMGHDFWPRAECVRTMSGLRRVFPSARAFSLCDTYRSGRVPSSDVPILTLGFEYVHSLMGQYLPTLAEWHEVFVESGWRSHREHELVIPPFTRIFHLQPDHT